MTETYSGELSEDTKRALLWIFDAVADWRVRTAQRADDVHTGSSLLKDDEVTSPYLMSHAVRGALVSAVDHLDAFRALVQDAHVVHPRATLTLLRAALENGALAVWLLAPANRNERVLRRLRLQWADFHDGQNVGGLFEGDPAPRPNDSRAKLQAIARKRGLTDAQLALVAARPVPFSSIVRAAAREGGFLNLDERTAAFCWMATSGIAHARQWAVLSPALQRFKVPGAPDGNQGLLLSTSDRMLTMAAGAATVMTAKGWRLLDERRTRQLL
jgi:hypothetical protein